MVNNTCVPDTWPSGRWHMYTWYMCQYTPDAIPLPGRKIRQPGWIVNNQTQPFAESTVLPSLKQDPAIIIYQILTGGTEGFRIGSSASPPFTQIISSTVRAYISRFTSEFFTFRVFIVLIFLLILILGNSQFSDQILSIMSEYPVLWQWNLNYF